MRAGEECESGRVHGKRQLGSPKTSYIGNITKWMVGVWKKSRLIRGIALDGEDWCDVLQGRLITTTDGTRKVSK